MTMIDAEVLKIQHDTKERRFFHPQKGEGIKDAELTYELDTSGKIPIVNFVHTYVPETVQGIGLGKELVKEGISFVQANGYKMKADCPFVKSYFNEHPEYNHLHERR
ncbi:MAG: GNAT family N-acetyltransferase [Bacteroidota bacterium]